MANIKSKKYTIGKKSSFMEYRSLEDARRWALNEAHKEVNKSNRDVVYGIPIYSDGRKSGVVICYKQRYKNIFTNTPEESIMNFWISRGKIYRMHSGDTLSKGYSPETAFDYELIKIYEQY